MERNREGYLIADTQRECTKCGDIFAKKSRTVTLCNTCNSERVKSTSPEKKMLQRAKGRAKTKGLEFNLTVNDIDIPVTCPILLIPLVVHSGKSGGMEDSPSLDRKDSSKGYTPDNVWVISQLANAMKANSTHEDRLKFANWVLETH